MPSCLRGSQDFCDQTLGGLCVDRLLSAVYRLPSTVLWALISSCLSQEPTYLLLHLRSLYSRHCQKIGQELKGKWAEVVRNGTGKVYSTPLTPKKGQAFEV